MYLIAYLFLSALTFFYYYGNFLKRPKKVRSIVVLSGDFDWDTKMRVKEAIVLKKEFKNSRLILCGKVKYPLMLNLMKAKGYRDFITQNKSTNTIQDALFLKKKIRHLNLFPLAIVTSGPHLRRALHTFSKIFPKEEVYGFSTSDLLDLYSPFLPTGWIAALINVFKDWKYNGKIF